jgi:molybdopterin converting factor subunit 1
MIITVRLFAILRERAGQSELKLDLPAGATIAMARDELLKEVPGLAGLIDRVAFALNRNYVPVEAELSEGDELALIPPVSGG